MAQVDAVIDAIPDEQAREAARVEWQYAGGVQRSHPLIASLAPALGYDTEEKINQLFRDAEGL